MKAGIPAFIGTAPKFCQCEFLRENLLEGERYWCPLHGLMDENGKVEKPVDLETFREFEKHFPLAAVELVIYRRDGHYLLVHRAIEPSANQWTTPGGIILRGETFEEAAIRVARREVGMKVEPVRVLTPRIHLDKFRHSIGIPVVCFNDNTVHKLSDDGENDALQWFPGTPPGSGLEDYYADMLKEAGVLRYHEA